MCAWRGEEEVMHVWRGGVAKGLVYVEKGARRGWFRRVEAKLNENIT
jgi:hypothetical protein